MKYWNIKRNGIALAAVPAGGGRWKFEPAQGKKTTSWETREKAQAWVRSYGSQSEIEEITYHLAEYPNHVPRHVAGQKERR
jgi:hypothetical protein